MFSCRPTCLSSCVLFQVVNAVVDCCNDNALLLGFPALQVDFLATLRRYGVMIGQPAHTLTSHNTFILLGLPEDRELFLQRLKDEAQDIDTQLRQDPTRMLRRTDLIGRNVSRSMCQW